MRRIGKTFESLQKRQQKALIPFLMVGDPDTAMTVALVLEVTRKGATMVELGVPFSDPVADGPTLQAASQRALQRGTTIEDLFKVVHKIRRKVEIPLIAMSYFNPIFCFGLEKFLEQARGAGLDGVIIADLPQEEAWDYCRKARDHFLDTIFMVAPTTPPSRIRRICRVSQGFVYCVSVTGTTGTRDRLPIGLHHTIDLVRSQTKKPVAVGFGISTPLQAATVASMADGIIVGSALAKIVTEEKDRDQIIKKVGTMIGDMVKAIIRASPHYPDPSIF